MQISYDRLKQIINEEIQREFDEPEQAAPESPSSADALKSQTSSVTGKAKATMGMGPMKNAMSVINSELEGKDAQTQARTILLLLTQVQASPQALHYAADQIKQKIKKV